MTTTRREFLRTSALGALGLGLMGRLDPARSAPLPRASVASAGDSVIVAVNLFGGNDGLNTIVPLAQYERYRQLRPTLGWQPEQLLPLPGYEGHFGVNRGLGSLMDVFAQGRMAIVTGVGYPPETHGLFDHDASQQNLQSGDTYGSVPPGVPSGWLGRFLDDLEPVEVPRGVNFSEGMLLLRGQRSQPLSLRQLEGFGVYPSHDGPARYATYQLLQQLPSDVAVKTDNSQLRREVVQLSDTLQSITASYQVAAGVQYPDSEFARSMRDCAALIAADRGVRALAVGARGFSGFDTHVLQNFGGPDKPIHQLLWALFSDAIAAFYADLDAHALADRVVILLFSEFGRRAFENNDGGTDHGFGSLAFVIGGRVRGGVYGDYPDLRDEYLALNGHLDVHTDFRSVYSTILANHLSADPERILNGRFPPLAFL